MTTTKSKKGKAVSESGTTIKLSAPWGGVQQSISNVGSWSEDASPDIHNNFVTERTRIHEVYIREQAKNKRIGLVLSFLLILLSALMVLFAPDGREVISYWIGAALLVFAAGALGFGRIWGKASSISFGADQDRRKL